LKEFRPRAANPLRQRRLLQGHVRPEAQGSAETTRFVVFR
jgi:hypothetical protein